jgi:hypothetical protein
MSLANPNRKALSSTIIKLLERFPNGFVGGGCTEYVGGSTRFCSGIDYFARDKNTFLFLKNKLRATLIDNKFKLTPSSDDIFIVYQTSISCDELDIKIYFSPSIAARWGEFGNIIVFTRRMLQSFDYPTLSGSAMYVCEGMIVYYRISVLPEHRVHELNWCGDERLRKLSSRRPIVGLDLYLRTDTNIVRNTVYDLQLVYDEDIGDSTYKPTSKMLKRGELLLNRLHAKSFTDINENNQRRMTVRCTIC